MKSEGKDAFDDGVRKMAGAVCHELNQPLHVLWGYCELMKTVSQNDQEKILEIVEKASSQMERMKQLMNKFQKVAHCEKVATKQYVEGVEIVDLDETC